MATSAAHASFPSRPYQSGLGRPASTAPQNTYNAPAANPYQTSQYPAAGAFGGATQQQREAARLERERQERADRERREAEDRGVLDSLSEEHREEINEAFQLFDLDKDQHIDYHELKVALKALGFDLPKQEILGLLQTHGIPASTVHPETAGKAPQSVGARPTFAGPSRLLMPQAAFVMLAARMIVARDPRDEILRAFQLFDAEGKGSISLADLRRVARELGEGLQEEELQAMIEEFDMDGDGMISQEDFIGICLG
ncbi:Cell division control protein 31 [Sphaceloma murrayae]|uniref:Calmodulin n=1 Tax=Sphaceloma murrayae TaxID=2082308 RepID=A0A2K1QMJ7_9PEZI|nr:Cell division control protein 31 [Sphaceloma murrayae]